MSLKINYEKVNKIVSKIASFLDKNGKASGIASSFIDDANAYADKWPENDGKLQRLANAIHVSRESFTYYNTGGAGDSGYFDRDAWWREKKKLAKERLTSARDAAKGAVGKLDTGKLESATSDLAAIKKAMETVLDKCETFDTTPVPEFQAEMEQRQTARVDYYRQKYKPLGVLGVNDNVSDILNQTGAGRIAPSSISLSSPIGDYSSTGADITENGYKNVMDSGNRKTPIMPSSNADSSDPEGERARREYRDYDWNGSSNSSVGNKKDNDDNKSSLSSDGGYYAGRRPDEDNQDETGHDYVPRNDKPGRPPKPTYTNPSGNANIHDEYAEPNVGDPGKNDPGKNGSGTGGSSGGNNNNVDSEQVNIVGVGTNPDPSKVEEHQNLPTIDENLANRNSPKIDGLINNDLLNSTGPNVDNDLLSSTGSDSNTKTGLAGALGMAIGGPSIGVGSNIVTPTTPGVDMFSGINLGGMSVPNISIGGYNPYSFNIGSGSTLTFSNTDTGSLYNNINFSTTPGLDPVQSPNQLLENLNSLPESIRKKISSMDLDNRAESAYYSSMSNEELEEIKDKQIAKFRSMSKEEIKERLKKQGYSDDEAEIIANNENIGVVAFLVGEQNVTMEALRRALSEDDEGSEIKKPSLEELISGEAAARLLNPYQDEEVRKAAEEYEYAKEKYNRAVSKSNASSKSLRMANEKLRKTRIDIEQIDGTDINKWTKEHIIKYNDCVKIFMEEKETASNDLIATINAEKELQKAMEALKEAKDNFNKKMAEATSVDPSLLLLIGKKKEEEEDKEKPEEKEPFVLISKKKVMPDLQMHNLDNIEILEETGSLSSADKAVVEQNVSQSVETYQTTEQPVVENKPAENIPKEETVGSMEINGKKIEIKKSTNNFVEAPENES